MPIIKANQTSKIKGKGFIPAGTEVDVTESKKKELEKAGLLDKIVKSKMPSDEKEIKELVAKVADLEKQIEDGGDTSALTEEIKLLNETVAEKDEEIKLLNENIESLKNNTDLLGDKKK